MDRKPHLILIALAVTNLIYWFVLRDEVANLYHGIAHAWMTQFVDFIYPRFAVEKHRFPFHFFQYKADQIIIRMTIIGACVLIYLFLLNKKCVFSEKVSAFWNEAHHTKNIRFATVLFFIGLLFFTRTWYWDLHRLSQLAAFYKPLLLYRALAIALPGTIWLIGFYALMVVGCLMVIFNKKPVYGAVLAAFFFVFIHGFFLCFEKIDHGFATLSYAALLMPVAIFLYQKGVVKPEQSNWGLQLIKLVISLIYLILGMEKLLTSGFTWASADTFKAYIMLHQAPVGIWVAESDILSTILPLGALLFQLTFWLILPFPKLKYVYLPLGIAFHTGAMLLLGVGSFFSPWIFVYIFFVDWSFLFRKTNSGLSIKIK